MTTTQTFAVPDVSCDHCVTAITAAVSEVAGVESVDVDLDGKTVQVVGGQVDEVIAAIDIAGYEASAIAATTGRGPAVAEQQLDDGVVRVTKWTFPPGTETGDHVHQFDYVVVPVTGGALTIESGDEISIAELAVGGSYQRAKGVAHNVANDGDAEVAFVEIELLDR